MIKKKEKINKIFLIPAVVFCCAVLLFPFSVSLFRKPNVRTVNNSVNTVVKMPTTRLVINKNYFLVEIASTDEEKILGLGGRKSLDDKLNVDTGMLFVFSEPSIEGFWMKDMNFPIDIVWMDQNKKITGYVEGAKPEDFPKIYESPGEVSYVLEISKGQVKSKNIKIGDTANFAF